jgi:hypothetical protein
LSCHHLSLASMFCFLPVFPVPSFHKFLNRTISIITQITFVEFFFTKTPSDVLKNDSSYGGGVIDDWNSVDVLSIDWIFDNWALETWIELPLLLSGDDGRRTWIEAVVVDASDGGVMVGEFRLKFEAVMKDEEEEI